MGRIAKGTMLQRGGRFYVQVTLSDARRAFPLATCTTPDDAEARAVIVAELVRRLRDAGHENYVVKTAERAARATPEQLESIKQLVASIIKGDETPAAGAFTPSKKTTFRELGEAWTSGALHRTYPDHVPTKATAADDAWRLEKHVYKVVESIPVAHFTLDDAQEVLRKLDSDLSPASRRHIAQLMARVLKLAAYPCRIIVRSPLPPGFLPRAKNDKALEYLYPDEDAKLLGCTKVSLVYRMAYGILAREGMRSGVADANVPFVKADLFAATRMNTAFALSCFQIDYHQAGVRADPSRPIPADPMSEPPIPAIQVAKIVMDEIAFRRLRDELNELFEKVGLK